MTTPNPGWRPAGRNANTMRPMAKRMLKASGIRITGLFLTQTSAESMAQSRRRLRLESPCSVAGASYGCACMNVRMSFSTPMQASAPSPKIRISNGQRL